MCLRPAIVEARSQEPMTMACIFMSGLPLPVPPTLVVSVRRIFSSTGFVARTRLGLRFSGYTCNADTLLPDPCSSLSIAAFLAIVSVMVVRPIVHFLVSAKYYFVVVEPAEQSGVEAMEDMPAVVADVESTTGDKLPPGGATSVVEGKPSASAEMDSPLCVEAPTPELDED